MYFKIRTHAKSCINFAFESNSMQSVLNFALRMFKNSLKIIDLCLQISNTDPILITNPIHTACIPTDSFTIPRTILKRMHN